MSGAVFLDRDGTIIVDTHYPRDPASVTLIDGAARAITLANSRGVPTIVVTNQSGIGRGVLTEAQYQLVHDQMTALLAEEGAQITATYYCPHSPEHDGACECRKPGLGMYKQAAAECRLVLGQSAYIGDRWRDVEPGTKLGGVAILVPSPATPMSEIERATREARVANTLGEAMVQALAYITGSSAKAGDA